MRKYPNSAIVLGGGINGLGVVRNLGRSGVNVFCVVGSPDEAIYSKYCKGYFVIPGIGHSKEKLKHFLTAALPQFRDKAVVFPTSDDYVLNLSDLKEELKGYCFTVPDREPVETLIKKTKFYQSLTSNEVPHPKTYFSYLEEIEEKITYPIFVKPSMSQVFSKQFGKKGFVANSKMELFRYLTLVRKHGVDVMIQEIVPGPPTNHIFIDGYLGKDSNLSVVFARRRLRMYPTSFGNSTACMSIPISDATSTKEILVKYLRSIGYYGIFSAEFKKDERENTDKLLEINARSWWYNSFPTRCGVNIILTAYLDAIGEDVKCSEAYELDTKLIYFSEDLKSILSMLARRDFKPRDWVRSYVGKKEWAFFARDDPRPFVMNLAYTLRKDIMKGV